ncbi:hypothetical protein PMG11_11216 [Penicillium brasilianum]|uniref:Uncharacterized protein n=1 Tax=Penicillium brasilianum TaxID=104259 RepID=A0A0F7U4Q7_PENBI|nr:hypothetical protein PMG11_11216 [Penicillium brasilianum]
MMQPSIKSTQSERGYSRSKPDVHMGESGRFYSRPSATCNTYKHRVLRSAKRSATDQLPFPHKERRQDDSHDGRSVHKECFKHMSRVQEKLFRALEDQDQERVESAQIIQRLQMEKAEEMTKLRKALADNESLSCEAKNLQVEASQLQQQLESFNSAVQGQVAWNDLQPALYQAHGDLIAAATQFWRNMEAIQNRQLATYLPGSGVVDAAWAGQVSAQGPIVPTSLPEISELGE